MQTAIKLICIAFHFFFLSWRGHFVWICRYATCCCLVSGWSPFLHKSPSMSKFRVQIKVTKSHTCKFMQYQWFIFISDCWKFSVKTHLYCIWLFVLWSDNHKQISKSSSCSTNELFLLTMQIYYWILSVWTHLYCINLPIPVMHLTDLL